jgi:hypothetical protein
MILVMLELLLMEYNIFFEMQTLVEPYACFMLTGLDFLSAFTPILKIAEIITGYSILN